MEKETMGSRYRSVDGTQSKTRFVPTECKAVLHGFKTDSKEQDVRAIAMESIKATGMKDELTVDFPAIPITHAFVEFQDTKTRDRFVRSANMRRYELDGRRIKIPPALEPDERFDRKSLGYVKCVLHKEKGFALHWIHMNLQRKALRSTGRPLR